MTPTVVPVQHKPNPVQPVTVQPTTVQPTAVRPEAVPVQTVPVQTVPVVQPAQPYSVAPVATSVQVNTAPLAV